MLAINFHFSYTRQTSFNFLYFQINKNLLQCIGVAAASLQALSGSMRFVIIHRNSNLNFLRYLLNHFTITSNVRRIDNQSMTAICQVGIFVFS
jgi:hypothetical protein